MRIIDFGDEFPTGPISKSFSSTPECFANNVESPAIRNAGLKILVLCCGIIQQHRTTALGKETRFNIMIAIAPFANDVQMRLVLQGGKDVILKVERFKVSWPDQP